MWYFILDQSVWSKPPFVTGMRKPSTADRSFNSWSSYQRRRSCYLSQGKLSASKLRYIFSKAVRCHWNWLFSEFVLMIKTSRKLKMNVWDAQRWNTGCKECHFIWRSCNLKSVKGTIRLQILIKLEGDKNKKEWAFFLRNPLLDSFFFK